MIFEKCKKCSIDFGRKCPLSFVLYSVTKKEADILDLSGLPLNGFLTWNVLYLDI